MKRRTMQNGFTLIELLIAVVLGTLIVVGMSAVMRELAPTGAAIQERNRLTEDGRFAMERMVRAVRESRQLILPMPDKPATDWRESVREETVPASPPEGSSTKATAVLAVSLSATVDLDADGFPDADNDRDGRIDEDYPADIAYDFGPGVYLIDDGGDGLVDEGFFADADDDERFNSSDEDPINGIDDDADGVTDEDPGADMNGDGAPGLAGVDDDGDGQVDEGVNDDDDEDGTVDEDWLDVVVFSLQGGSLIERHPVPWDETANGFMSGRDFIESAIAENVTGFGIERLASSGSAQIVDITLAMTGPETGETVSLHTRVRIGSAP